MTIDERIGFLMQSIESHDRQIGELTDKMGELTSKVDNVTDAVAKLVKVTNDDATAHERRIAGLEGQGQNQ